MSRKIAVPEAMFKAFIHAENHAGDKWDDDVLRKMLEAALRWLSEHPIIPTSEQWSALVEEMTNDLDRGQGPADWIREWQRRMFLAPELEAPEEIENLLWDAELYRGDGSFHLAIPNINRTIIEAFRRGQKSKQ